MWENKISEWSKGMEGGKKNTQRKTRQIPNLWRTGDQHQRIEQRRGVRTSMTLRNSLLVHPLLQNFIEAHRS
jgi:hypothetical protein